MTRPWCYPPCRSGVVGVPRAERSHSQVDSQAKSLAFSASSIASPDTSRQGGSHGNSVQEGPAAGGGLWRRREGGSHDDQESNNVKQSAADAEPAVSKEEAKVRGQGDCLPSSLLRNPALLVPLQDSTVQ